MDGGSKPLDEGHNWMGSEKTRFMSMIDNVEYNHRATVMKEIANINFTALIELNLGGNQISSIEEVSHLQIPHIK